jgi:hypothetical protein
MSEPDDILSVEGRTIRCASCGTSDPRRLPSSVDLLLELSRGGDAAHSRPIFCRKCSLGGALSIVSEAVEILDDPRKGETPLQRLESAWLQMRPELRSQDLPDGPVAEEVLAIRRLLFGYFDSDAALPTEPETQAAIARIRRLRDSISNLTLLPGVQF